MELENNSADETKSDECRIAARVDLEQKLHGKSSHGTAIKFITLSEAMYAPKSASMDQKSLIATWQAVAAQKHVLLWCRISLTTSNGIGGETLQAGHIEDLNSGHAKGEQDSDRKNHESTPITVPPR